jgi:hypothetical protein
MDLVIHGLHRVPRTIARAEEQLRSVCSTYKAVCNNGARLAEELFEKAKKKTRGWEKSPRASGVGT